LGSGGRFGGVGVRGCGPAGGGGAGHVKKESETGT
jgi:hypothetical protein